MLDYVITGGTVVDGTGAPERAADVGVRDGRIAVIAEPGSITEEATTTLRRHRPRRLPRLRRPPHPLRRPALLGPARHPVERPRRHVHHRRQLRLHAGAGQGPRRRLPAPHDGQGRGHAAGRARDRHRLDLGVLRRLPRPPRRQASASTPASSSGTARCAATSWARPPSATRRPPSRSRPWCRCSTARSRPAGSASRRPCRKTHSDGDGQPVASRWASKDELIALCAAVGEHEGTTLEGIVDGCLEYFSEDEVELLTAMSVAADRPINWNVLTVDSKRPDQVAHQLAGGHASRRRPAAASWPSPCRCSCP